MSEAGEVVEHRAAARDAVEFRGHPLVKSTHQTTIEVTAEEYLTEEGECIIGVGASKGCAGLSPDVQAGIRRQGSRVTVRILAHALSFEVKAWGDPRLRLSDPRDLVIRRSDFASDRTLAVRADAAARDIPREMVRLLKDPSTRGRLEIEVA